MSFKYCNYLQCKSAFNFAKHVSLSMFACIPMMTTETLEDAVLPVRNNRNNFHSLFYRVTGLASVKLILAQERN